MRTRRHVVTPSWATIVRWRWWTRQATIVWLVDGKRVTRTDALYLLIPWAQKNLPKIWLTSDRYAFFSVGNTDYLVPLTEYASAEGVEG